MGLREIENSIGGKERGSVPKWRVLNLMRNCNHIPQFIEVAEGTTVGPEAIEPVTSHYMATVH